MITTGEKRRHVASGVIGDVYEDRSGYKRKGCKRREEAIREEQRLQENRIEAAIR